MLFKQARDTVKTKKDKRGFTLIEVLIAMAIFSIGILAVGAMQVTSNNSNASARMHTEGYTWLVDRIEWLTRLDYEDPDLAAGDHAPPAEGAFTITYNVQDDTPVTGAKTIRVTVDGDNPRARPLSIDYIKAR